MLERQLTKWRDSGSRWLVYALKGGKPTLTAEAAGRRWVMPRDPGGSHGGGGRSGRNGRRHADAEPIGRNLLERRRRLPFVRMHALHNEQHHHSRKLIDQKS